MKLETEAKLVGLIVAVILNFTAIMVVYNIAYEQGARHGVAGYVMAHPECK